MVKKRGLGKSLDALLAYTQSGQHVELNSHNDRELSMLSIDVLQRGKYQPRREMDDKALEELSNSIKAQGILQPLIVRPLVKKEGAYEIVAGERRYRAAILAGLKEVPVMVHHIPDEAAIAIALIENIQRENLNPIEEAIALERLINEFQLTHQEIAEKVGKSRANVTNLLRLLHLPDSVKSLLEKGLIEMGHARTLIPLSEELQLKAAKAIMDHGFSVRQTEEWVREVQIPKLAKSPATKTLLLELKKIEKELSKNLNLKISIKGTVNKGKLVIHYKNKTEWDHLLQHLDPATSGVIE